MHESYVIPLLLGTASMVALMMFFVMALLFAQKSKQNNFKREMLEARLEEQEKTLSEISRNLHDNVAQLLGHINMNLSFISRFRNTEEDVEPYIQSSSDYLQKAMNDVRHMSHSLSSQFLKSKGLVGAITEDIDHIKATTSIDCSIEVEGDEYDMKDETELAIFRIAQEVINNMVKHSQAITFTIRMDYMPSLFTITFSDDGKGFNPKVANPNSGVGLLNLNERATLLGGTVDITSAPNKGCTTTFSMPIKAGEAVALPTD